MNYFIDPKNGQLYAYDDDCHPEYMRPGLEGMTEAEYCERRDAALPAPDAADFRSAIQAHMDEAAVGLGYDDLKSAISYADEPAVPRFQKDGIAFREWRSLVWGYSYEQLELIEAGAREKPTISEFIGELPKLPDLK